MPQSPSILEEPRPWAFSYSELAAGLRRYTEDPTLNILRIEESEIPALRSAMGRIRGLQVQCQSDKGNSVFDLVVKQHFGATRAGTVSAGWRESSLYSTLSDLIPICLPKLLASSPHGEWLILSQLPGGLPPEKWTADEYFFAVDELARLHDRFWGQGEYLKTYTWLARPLDADLSIYTTAASTGIEHLIQGSSSSLLIQDQELLDMLTRVIQHSEATAAFLRSETATLIHGDYWPGNLKIYPDKKLYAIDWQRTGIGPGILDLVSFIQLSTWWFETLPVSTNELFERYRNNLKQSCGHTWTDEAWDMLWDHALIWIFLSNWADLLVNIPNAILKARMPALYRVWFNPVKVALERRFR